MTIAERLAPYGPHTGGATKSHHSQFSVAVHHGHGTATLAASELEVAIGMLRQVLGMIRADNEWAFGTVRGIPSGLLAHSETTDGDEWLPPDPRART